MHVILYPYIEKMPLEAATSSGTSAPVYILGGCHMALNDFIYGNNVNRRSITDDDKDNDMNDGSGDSISTKATLKTKTIWNTRPPIHIRYGWLANLFSFFNELV